MTHGVMIRRATTALAAIAGVLATGASSASATSAVNAATATCTAPALAQPFSSASDTNWYAPLPGESWNSFPATGWTLSGGAKVVSATLADGTRGTTLDLPAGAQAVSPGMCVTNDDPSARGEIRMTSGSSSVTVSVAYMGPKTWGSPQASSTIAGVSTGWTLAIPLSIHPSKASGWQFAQFTFVAASTGEYQLSNFYVDPKMRH